MIAHQTVGMHLPFGLPAGFPQGGEEAFTIRVVPEDVLALIAVIHQVINRARILNAQFARHSARLSHPAKSVNSED